MKHKSKKAIKAYIADAKTALIRFAAYLVMFIYWETVMYAQIHGSLAEMSVFIYAFTPAFAMLFTALSGWFTKLRVPDVVIDAVISFAVAVFYASQTVYFRIFGSMYSVSMMGMGTDAVENFGWALRHTLSESVLAIFVVMLPALVVTAVRIFLYKRSAYRARSHAVAAVAAVLLWLLAVAALPLGGKAQYSAYMSYHSSLVDTDSASAKIGVLANTSVEAARTITGTGRNTGEDKPDSEKLTPLKPIKPVVPIDDGKTDDPVTPAEPEYNVIEAIDFDALYEKAEKKDVKSVCEYLASVEGTRKNDMTGIFKGYNLIYICAESFSSYAIDPDITPTLYKLATGGIVLNNFYNSFKNTTTNGEYAFLTALWPDVSRVAKWGTTVGSFPQSADNYMPMGLGKLFNEQRGAVSRGYHNYKGYYYSRDKSLPNLGFECKFMGSGMKFTSAWPSSDYEMMQQSVDDYINDDCFCAYYMTFSGHGPYSSENVIAERNISTVKKLAAGKYKSETALYYFAANYELEKAMAYLVERLEEAGKLNRTVIVLIGDHYPYYLPDSARNAIVGSKVDGNFGIYENTCTIYNAALAKPIVTDTPCCNVDIFPTVMNLFGIEYDSRLVAGTDIFSDSTHVAALYNKSFVTEYVKYNSANGKAEWLEPSVNMTDEEKTAYLDSMIEYVRAKYVLSLEIADTDFYKFVWENSDIPQ